MSKKLRVGESWGALSVTQVYREDLIQPESGIIETGAGPWVFSLTCACGKTFDVSEPEFQGKAHTRDCGCGLGQIPKRAGRPRTTMSNFRAISVLLPLDLIDWLERRADLLGSSVGYVIRSGLSHYRQSMGEHTTSRVANRMPNRVANRMPNQMPNRVANWGDGTQGDGGGQP